MFQSVALSARRIADSGRQHVNMRAIQEFLLDAVVAFALRELLVGQLAVEGDDAREILLELAVKDEAAFGEILALYLFAGFSGALVEICEPDAEFNDAAVLR